MRILEQCIFAFYQLKIILTELILLILNKTIYEFKIVIKIKHLYPLYLLK